MKIPSTGFKLQSGHYFVTDGQTDGRTCQRHIMSCTSQSWLCDANCNPQCRVGNIDVSGMHPRNITKLSVQESFACPELLDEYISELLDGYK